MDALQRQCIVSSYIKDFKNVTAYAILNNEGVKVGSIALKYMPSGVVHCYFHLLGEDMIFGKAGAFDYDRIGASIEDAYRGCNDELRGRYKALESVTNDGQWQEVLRAHGLKVILVI